MPYITREDGVHFVIPSYRDTLVVKQKSALKNEIITLSQNYGGYITLQEKGVNQYEVAFSPDTGYLLGESIWHYFKRPLDLIYCEAIPSTTEVLLVIVKAGSVYLDGRFPAEGVAEELIIFLTQQNNFEINIYGDVPISKTPETGKFSFEETSVKAFNVLDAPVFPTLPLYKIYQLQLVDTVLKAHSIGVLPIRQAITAIALIALLWFGYSYWSSHKEVFVPAAPPPTDPYAGYYATLTAPAPEVEINEMLQHIQPLFGIVGWYPVNISYARGTLQASMTSQGGTVEQLLTWAARNGKEVKIEKAGFSLTEVFPLPNRDKPKEIFAINDIIATFVDRLAKVYPGNNMDIGDFSNKPSYTEVFITVRLSAVSPLVLILIADQLKGLPIVLQSITANVNNGNLSGSMILQALGN